MPDLFTIITLAAPIALALFAGLGFILWMPRREVPARVGQELPTPIAAETAFAEAVPVSEPAASGQRVA